MKCKIVKGDDASLVFTVKDADSVAVNITGATAVAFKVAASATATPVISKSLGSGIALTTPASGILTVTLTDTDTSIDAGTYYFEVQITDASGNISTLRASDGSLGELIILEDII
jgi:hypothetical protein